MTMIVILHYKTRYNTYMHGACCIVPQYGYPYYRKIYLNYFIETGMCCAFSFFIVILQANILQRTAKIIQWT